eukprot:TRINITY_DN55886_c0_g1_i1.p1 TRINITY_DN55886_c0_g1~~TRINITY_DN55886_c0_g1_i1.p1  ORF type:complete len:639 (+),score=96.83 TRINITY_DN55886_c0_g1_i1:232-1917(+)
MDLRLNTQSENYDSQFNAARDENPQKEVTLTSHTTNPMTNYTIGILTGDGFHMTTLNNIFHMRPKVADGRGSTRIIMEAEQAPTKAKQLTKEQALAAQRFQESLFSYRTTKAQSEEFQILRHVLADRNEAHAERGRILWSEEARPLGVYDAEKYRNMVFPSVTEEVSIADSRKLQKIPLCRLSEYSVEHQVFSLMSSSVILPYTTIANLVHSKQHVKEKDAGAQEDLRQRILAALDACAVLIQGVWVVKSLPKYVGNVLAPIREYILYRFHKHPIVCKGQIMRALPPACASVANADEIKSLFEEIAVLHRVVASKDEEEQILEEDEMGMTTTQRDKVGGEWTLKCTDPDFLKDRRNQDMIKRQSVAWVGRIVKIEATLKAGTTDQQLLWAMPDAKDMKKSIMNKPTQKVETAQRTRFRALKAFVENMLKEYGVVQRTKLQQKYKEKKQDATDPLHMTEDEEFSKVLAYLVEPIQCVHGAVVLKTKGSGEEKDKNKREQLRWRRVVKEAFERQMEWKKDKLLSHATEREGCAPPPGIFDSALKEFATTPAKGTWKVKPGWIT